MKPTKYDLIMTLIELLDDQENVHSGTVVCHEKDGSKTYLRDEHNRANPGDKLMLTR